MIGSNLQIMKMIRSLRGDPEWAFEAKVVLGASHFFRFAATIPFGESLVVEVSDSRRRNVLSKRYQGNGAERHFEIDMMSGSNGLDTVRISKNFTTIRFNEIKTTSASFFAEEYDVDVSPYNPGGCAAISEVVMMDLSRVTTCRGMFYGASRLKKIPEVIDVPSAVTDLSYMFCWCSSLKVYASIYNDGVRNMTINAPGALNASAMFARIGYMDVLPYAFTFNCPLMEDCSYMFYRDSSMYVDGVFTSGMKNVRTFAYAFAGATSSGYNDIFSDKNEHLEDCSGMFAGFRGSNFVANVSIPHDVRNCASMFAGSQTLVRFGLDDDESGEYYTNRVVIGSSVTDASNMFSGCAALGSDSPFIIAFGDYSYSGGPTDVNVENIDGMFRGCASMTEMQLTIGNVILPRRSLRFPSSVTSCNGSFRGCVSLTAEPVASTLWNRQSEFTGGHDGCFEGCTSMTGYEDIPDGWK